MTDFVVFFENDCVVRIEVFDSFDVSQRGRVVVDFDTLRLSVPDYFRFLKDYKVFEWADLSLDYMGG